jgi:hypothetical protein
MTPTTDLLPDTAPPPQSPAAPNPLDEPTADECYAEMARYFATPGSVLDPGYKHPDEFVAFFDGKPLDYDPDPTELRKRVAAAFGIHPERLVIAYLGDYQPILRN